MDIRAEKIAKARQKLKDHQGKKIMDVQREQCSNKFSIPIEESQHSTVSVNTDYVKVLDQDHVANNKEEEPLKESTDDSIKKKSHVNITEILISTKTKLETQISNLTEKLTQLQELYGIESSNHNIAKQRIVALEHELSVLSNKYEIILRDVSESDENISELNNLIRTMRDENNNLVEQLEVTKSMLTAKEIEIKELHSQIKYCQQELDAFQLQIQQLTNNTTTQANQRNNNSGDTESFNTRISQLEKTIEALEKEKDQLNCHYEHYLNDLNKQYRSEIKRNECYERELQNFYTRENNLVEQISEMEIRLQNLNNQDNTISKQENDTELQKQFEDSQVKLMEISTKYQELQKQYMDSLAKIEQLNQVKDTACNHDNISIDKLNADITSDKIAAQRATEQNRKLKSDVEDLEQVIIKMGNDKLELTEMWTHEKQLNKSISLKLAEVEENIQNIMKQLKAKDEEMIRLQNENRDLEKKYESIKESVEQNNQSKQKEDAERNYNHDDSTPQNDNSNYVNIPGVTSKVPSNIEVIEPITKLDIRTDNIIPNQDAMSKLQDRFLNIMDQVANLSDEKHRLEHIILQLQNETDTICEYVALYQQQRSLLKKREEERSNQLNIYQTECNKLKRHLEELHNLLMKFAGDKEMETFFQNDQRFNDLTRVKELLEELQNCSLINPNFKNLDLNIFYPCSCCSGQVIVI